MGLPFIPGLVRGVECSKNDSEVVLADISFAIRTERREHRADFLEILWIDWSSVKIALAELNAHCLLPFFIAGELTLVEHYVHFPHVGLVVNHSAIDLYPGMGFERSLLSADQQPCRHSILL